MMEDTETGEVNGISGVRHVYSFSREGVSTVVVEFRLEERINEVIQEARAKVNAIRGILPKGIEEPIIQKLDFNAMPIVLLIFIVMLCIPLFFSDPSPTGTARLEPGRPHDCSAKIP